MTTNTDFNLKVIQVSRTITSNLTNLSKDERRKGKFRRTKPANWVYFVINGLIQESRKLYAAGNAGTLAEAQAGIGMDQASEPSISHAACKPLEEQAQEAASSADCDERERLEREVAAKDALLKERDATIEALWKQLEAQIETGSQLDKDLAAEKERAGAYRQVAIDNSGCGCKECNDAAPANVDNTARKLLAEREGRKA